jgi:hypothetical protein
MGQIGRLTSVGEIMRVHGGAFANTTGMLAFFEHIDPHVRGAFDPEAWATFRQPLLTAAENCRHIGFEISANYAERWLKHLDQYEEDRTFEELRQIAKGLSDRFYEEASANVLILIEPRKRHFYEAEALFGALVEDRFPSVSQDIAEAGRCFAVDRFPATIFHLMRVAERALRAIALELKVPMASTKKGRSWGGVIHDVTEKLAAMPDDARAKIKFREPMYFLSEVKDLWRDKGIHPVEDFSPERTERVYNSIRSFMQTCAERDIAEPTEDLS